MAAATAALPTVTLFGAAATGNILAAASVMAASGAVWVPAAVNRARATRAAVNSASPARAAVVRAAVVVIRVPPTPVAVTAVVAVIRVPPTPVAVTAAVITAN
jgi:hypothetical protein